MTKPKIATSPSKSLNHRKMLSAWDDSRQAHYRQLHGSLSLHFVLDASPSMFGQRAKDLLTSFNVYLAWLKRHADPMSLAEVRCFSDYVEPSCPVPLGQLTPLTPQSYRPEDGNGTALYRAIGEVCTQAPMDGEHVLIVFTDGNDNLSKGVGWPLHKAAATLEAVTKQGWLAVFLGAMPRSE